MLAPIQFAACLISIFLVLRFLVTGTDAWLAHSSILIKTVLLLTIMFTGCLWERDVFGQYLFAPAFFWEDVVSMGVIALHLAYVYGLLMQQWSTDSLMIIALLAYAAYLVNAVQFVLKLRAARLQSKANLANEHDLGQQSGTFHPAQGHVS